MPYRAENGSFAGRGPGNVPFGICGDAGRPGATLPLPPRPNHLDSGAPHRHSKAWSQIDAGIRSRYGRLTAHTGDRRDGMGHARRLPAHRKRSDVGQESTVPPEIARKALDRLLGAKSGPTAPLVVGELGVLGP